MIMPASKTQFSQSIENILLALKKNSDLSDILPNLLQELAVRLQCQWVTYWKVNFISHELKPFMTWSSPGFEAQALARDTRDRRLSMSEGTAGLVWRTKRPIWTLDLSRDMCLPRSLDARNVGLNGGIWFPVKTDGKVNAVIELLGKEILPPSEELISDIRAFGIQLGTELKEKCSDK